MNLVLDVIVSPDLVSDVTDNVKRSKVVPATTDGVRGFVEAVRHSLGRGSMTAWKEIGNSPDSIKVLRIWSHGFVNFEHSELENGNINFGKPVINSLNAKNYKDFETNLSFLTPCFAKPARVELRGCISAKGTGNKLLLNLANLWQVDIYGSDQYQPQILNWSSRVFVAKPSVPNIIPTRGFEVNE